MSEIMPFGKYEGRSVEQIVLNDYKYFDHVIDKITLHKNSLKERFHYVEKVVNNFVSGVDCITCHQYPAEQISIYYGYSNSRLSDLSHLYCSSNCYNNDNVSPKSVLYPLGFKSALSTTNSDTNGLISLMAECMGLSKIGKSKEYLEDFFNNVDLRKNNYEQEGINLTESKKQLTFWE